MTDPYAERPSEEGEAQARPTVTWWGSLDTADSRRVSPICASYDAAVRWLEAEGNDDQEPRVWERTKRGSLPAEDVQVWPPVEEGTQRDHLAVMTRSLAEKLTDARRRRDLVSTGRKGSGHAPRPATSMDPTTRMLSYDEVYDEHGAPRFVFGPDGWITGEAKQ